MLKEVDGYTDLAVGDVPQQRVLTHNAIDRQEQKLQGEGMLSKAESDELNGLTSVYTAFIASARTSLLKAVRAGLSGLLNPPSMDEVNASLAEAQHALFKKLDDDKLEKLKEAAEKVAGITSKAKWVADNAQRIITDVEMAKKVFEISEKLEKFKGVIEELLEIRQLGSDLLTIASHAGGGDSILGGGDAIAAGVDLAGLLGKPLMKSVPLFGDYWNKYLVPLTKKCCAALSKLEDLADEMNRQQLAILMETPSATPPVLPKAAYLTFEGGREVFEYLYLTRFGQQPAMSEYVEKVIMKHREALEKATGEEVEREKADWYNPLTWFNRKAKDLPWVKSHIGQVWASFYGAAGVPGWYGNH